LSSLGAAILEGDHRAVARGISLVEDNPDEGATLVRELFARSGRAFIVGVTGAPGAGKSTLADGLVSRWRKQGRKVAVIAVDPTSPFSGGAMLGDRVRMQAHARDTGVFIRSMATRGHLGGLAQATADATVVLDAAGNDLIVIETVGVGQDEVEIVRTADVSVVVLVPGMGDDVQALKAGVMEIADVFVVNKSDRDGTDRTVADVESLLSLQTFDKHQWKPPIVKTTATTGDGVDALAAAIERFRENAPGILATRRHERAGTQLRAILADAMLRTVDASIDGAELEHLIDGIADRQLDPYSAAETVLKRSFKSLEGTK